MVHGVNESNYPLEEANRVEFSEAVNSTGNQHANNLLLSGIKALNSGDSQNAIFWLEQCKLLIGDRFPENYLQAIALIRMNRLDEAEASLRPLTVTLPMHPRVRHLSEHLQLLTKTPARSEPRSVCSDQKNKYYGVSLLTPTTLANIAASYEIWQEILSFHQWLATDEYVEYVDNFYRESMGLFGSHWHYLDISNVLFAAAKIIRPEKYLEIGVRRGRSVCMVSRGYPGVDIYAFDMWTPEYAGMPNPGPDFVQSELNQHGHQGKVVFINGDSHRTLPEFFKHNSELKFDLITVDGDHSEEGAWADLQMVAPRLSEGGILVFDDISHPAHPYLIKVWRKTIEMFPFLSPYEYTEKGYGVAFAIRQD